jgi:glycosyltransferase involved in cell wall biosynthesis
MASVTVVIPAYNSASFLEETLQSALDQTDPPESIVVVDDESPDDSFAVAKKVAATNPSVQAVRRKNGGACAARNTGLAMAKTEFVLFLDADDRLLSRAIEHHLAVMERHSEAVMVFGSNHVISAEGARIGKSIVPDQDVTLEDLAMAVTPCASQCLYRRSAVQQVGGMNETLSDGLDLNMRLVRLGKIISYPEFVMEYRKHPNQLTKNKVIIAGRHLRALELNIGPKSASPDPVLYKRARRKWLARYGHGQHMAALGAIRHGRFKEVIPAARLALAGYWARLRRAEWHPKH